jgi:hypothetical protein
MLPKSTGAAYAGLGASAAGLATSRLEDRARDDCALVVDPATRDIAVTVRGHISAAAAFDMATQVATILRHQGLSTVTLDLLDVDSFDVHAPIQAIRPIAPIVSSLEGVDLIVRRWRVQLAAVSALYALGVPFQIFRNRKPQSLRSASGQGT